MNYEFYKFIKFYRIDLKTYFFIAFLTVATLGLSNSAVAYLNFPTFNMFKSCKLIPVMIGSMLILGNLLNNDY
jgi:adenosine 3'-phospho 5'-phosphosulfate transporter B3